MSSKGYYQCVIYTNLTGRWWLPSAVLPPGPTNKRRPSSEKQPTNIVTQSICLVQSHDSPLENTETKLVHFEWEPVVRSSKNNAKPNRTRTEMCSSTDSLQYTNWAAADTSKHSFQLNFHLFLHSSVHSRAKCDSCCCQTACNPLKSMQYFTMKMRLIVS